MSARRFIANLVLSAAALSYVPQPAAQAGPLLDWLFGYRTAARPAYPIGAVAPVGAGVVAPSYAGNYGNYYGSMMPVIGPTGYGYSAAQPNGIAAATAPTTMSYVPDYRTSSYRAPVTYYRPILTTDPNSGAQVVALAPCTSYEYQAQRIQTFGYNGLVGSFNTPPVQSAPQAMPTYTLPTGGVPLAANVPSTLVPSNGTYSTGYGNYTTAVPYSTGASALTPSYSSNYGSFPSTYGYSSNYGGYSALQPALTVPPAGNYPTAPFGSDSGYYGSPSGGSCGNLAPTTIAPGIINPGYTPGLVAPPAQTYPNASPNNYPVTPPPAGGVYPPTGGSSSDPNANVPPTLPPVGYPSSSAQSNRPQLRSIVRQPLSSESSQSREHANDSSKNSNVPTMSPIPAPAELESQPRWNPGLLDERDRTAMRPTAPAQSDAVYAGEAKTIHWASFTSDAVAASTGPTSQPTSRLRAIVPIQQPSEHLENARPTLEFSDSTVGQEAKIEHRYVPQSTASSPPARSTSGWKSAR